MNQRDIRYRLPEDDNNPGNLESTNEHRKHLTSSAIFVYYIRMVRSLGFDHVRFHDLRYSRVLYAHKNGVGMKGNTVDARPLRNRAATDLTVIEPICRKGKQRRNGCFYSVRPYNSG